MFHDTADGNQEEPSTHATVSGIDITGADATVSSRTAVISVPGAILEVLKDTTATEVLSCTAVFEVATARVGADPNELSECTPARSVASAEGASTAVCGGVAGARTELTLYGARDSVIVPAWLIESGQAPTSPK